MLRERGGSSSFARHAFNELIAFIAGWAILIDYLIVAALAAISVPHYLRTDHPRPLRPTGRDRHRRHRSSSPPACSTCFNVTGRGRERSLVVLALADIALQLAVIVVGVARRLPPRPAHRPAPPLHRARPSTTSSTRRWSRCSPTPGSRPPPTWPPTSTCGRATCSGSSRWARSRCRSSTPAWRRSR